MDIQNLLHYVTFKIKNLKCENFFIFYFFVNLKYIFDNNSDIKLKHF